MKITRKIVAVLLALCLVTLPCATAFAADAETTTDTADTVNAVDTTNSAVTQPSDDTEVTPRQSVGKLLAGRSNNFYGDGTIEVYLSSGNSWADIQAGTGGSSSTGMVHVSVKFPDGTWHVLGQIRASADHTDYIEFTYCPAGTYLFVFENSTNDWIQVYANIYD